ncbi:MAG: flagellar protein FlaG, partial [Candidatus Hydrogenedentes bacterium]|nr:flagellar protein FlaG [Candidatus Hydrogenedentota bacterium]
EVIKQIPPEEVLKISANFRRFTALLFDERA